MSEYIGHGSCMWRSTGIAAGDNKMIRVHGKLLLDVKKHVTFEWNILLNLSGGAATKTFSSLMMKVLLQVLDESTGTVTVWVIRGDEGVGDIPGVRGVQGGL